MYLLTLNKLLVFFLCPSPLNFIQVVLIVIFVVFSKVLGVPRSSLTLRTVLFNI
jgi:hypothetical protein